MNYDSDDARNLSPPLEKQKIVYEPHESPPPFIPDKSESNSPVDKSGTGRDRKRPRCRKIPKPSLSDELILRSLAPNDPEIAYKSREAPLRADSSSCSSPDSGHTSGAEEGSLQGLDGSTADVDVNMHRRPEESSRVQTLPVLNSPPATIAGSSSEGGSTVCQSLPSFRSSFPCEIVPDVISSKDHFLKNGVPQPTYPAVTSSPRQSHHSHSHSHGHHNSSQSHIRRLSEQFYPTPLLSSTASTPAYSHASPPKTCDISNVSTPSALHQPHYWPDRLKTDHSRPQSHSHSQSLSQSSCEPGSQYSDTPSTGYPTPTDPTSQEGPEKRHDTPTTTISSSGMFKCNYPGCVALPFQTQYLLNSHANVHSQFRPYYCPVQGCPRSEGGKGFKRKNEMIRHGLVHDSPGYVCPFCPDQRHKYPRPDNLQRHVRVHHIDKDREDPLLREVLAQRPEGANRGRRRRA
ncbi:C2H2 type zinc finger domain-containing protein [Microsporum canis CBS 113480]|uniref:C2H2 type zinc finger domain-containing protein n=1 Tax=Arthroderma otae (strain ATCC MYA-4605 / CBS 113480) TaxID=554155 RepID=C5FTD3_ARTOC|nr:C2H2 type zinc finger domain-containing protein [Microsporum canis CBS 113480]EEQ33136.1 C2H2 type zinc finger domain-containing protein [Microsporum canis CBS 113480]